MIEVRKEFEYDKINSFHKGNPYSISFIYPKDETPFILKGGLNDINSWILSKIKTPAVVHHILYHHQTHRRIIELINCDPYKMYYKCNLDKTSKYKYIMVIYKPKKTNQPFWFKEKKIRRIPRSWINDLNDLLDIPF